MNIKAIETRYNGHRFRSRLEARWAVFFDSLYIKWLYEPEGYHTPLGCYLPDFFLPDVNLRTTKPEGGMLFEVKPESPTDEEQEKLRLVAEDKNVSAGILVGPPNLDGGCDNLQIHPPWDSCMMFMQCPKCNRVKYEFQESNYMHCEICEVRIPFEDPRYINAVTRALSARFEHGENGR